MKLLDALMGRTKPAQPSLDALFSLPTAAITLQTTAGLMPTGRAGVCFKPLAGQSFEEMQSELESLLRIGDDASAPPLAVRHVADDYGYRWIIVEGSGADDLVTRVHMVHSSLVEAGWGAQLLCSVFGFAPAPGASETIKEPCYLVYLAKRGTFYPFAPVGREKRDTELELRIRSLIAGDLPMEEDLDRWFPLWGLPIA